MKTTSEEARLCRRERHRFPDNHRRDDGDALLKPPLIRHEEAKGQAKNTVGLRGFQAGGTIVRVCVWMGGGGVRMDRV